MLDLALAILFCDRTGRRQFSNDYFAFRDTHVVLSYFGIGEEKLKPHLLYPK